jgi:hypothetical protein
MVPVPHSARIGAQLWLEQEDSPDRVEYLVEQAARSGFGLLRIFLMWPWIQPEPETWTYELFDAAFEAAARHGVRIKATLTANSGPWHVGNPGVQHSMSLTRSAKLRPAMRTYIENCVNRYAGHEGLGQWVLWNEPRNPVLPPGEPGERRTDEHREPWTELLTQRYHGDLGALNRRWRTGYWSFAEVDFPEDVPDRSQQASVWMSFRPWLDEYHFRAATIRRELAWIAEIVRDLDPVTPLCINPDEIFSNHAAGGFDFTDLAGVTDVLGASFHAPWHLTFAPKSAHVPLLVAGTSLLAQTPGSHEAEVTEVQIGNTFYAGRVAMGVTPADIAAAYLAPLFGGAATVSGWCLNTRQRDFEAGDWGILDDADQRGPRTEAVAHVAGVLDQLDERLGVWSAVPPSALVLVSEESQALQLVHSWAVPSLPGRDQHDAVRGAGLLTAELLHLGVPSALAPISGLSTGAGLIVASHLTGWEPAFARTLLDRVAEGATLVLDGTSGHKDLDAGLHRPWPGVLGTELGVRATGLRTRDGGHPVAVYGAPAGSFPLAVTDFEFTNPHWVADEFVRLADGAGPCVWRRSYGKGRVVLVSGALGPAVLHDRAARVLARQVLAEASADLARPARPLGQDTITLGVHGEKAEAVGVFAPSRSERGGAVLRVALRPGAYDDLWTGEPVTVASTGEAVLGAEDGIAVLVVR